MHEQRFKENPKKNFFFEICRYNLVMIKGNLIYCLVSEKIDLWATWVQNNVLFGTPDIHLNLQK